MNIQDKLQTVFRKEEIEFKAQGTGLYPDGNPWVQVASYVQARAIQERLDECFGGFDGWSVAYRETSSGVICRIKVELNGKEIIKEDGAELTGDIGAPNALKGGCSGALKRVASSGFGIGRYLYKLPRMYSPNVQWNKPKNADNWQKGRVKVWNEQTRKNDFKSIWWEEPILPHWAYSNEDSDIVITEEKSDTKGVLEDVDHTITSYNTPEAMGKKLKELKDPVKKKMTLEEATSLKWPMGRISGTALGIVYKNRPDQIEYFFNKAYKGKFEDIKEGIALLDSVSKRTWKERLKAKVG